jgi:hypothetical protein
MIQDRNLTAGTKLVGRYHKQDRTCETHLDENGKLYFRLDDGRAFKSPSAAGTAVTGHACDGWHFWSIAGEAKPVDFSNIEQHIDKAASIGKLKLPKPIPTYDETVAKIDKMEKTEKPKPPKSGVYKLPNQKGAPAGLTRYYCFDCSSPFPAKSDIKNPVCPNCHPAK